MRLLFDTHLLIWAMMEPDRLPASVLNLLGDADNQPHFSVVSIWEVAIKRSLDRADFRFGSQPLRAALLASDYKEVALRGEHVTAVETLPWHHRDPQDRLLIAQAMVEGMLFLTADRKLSAYPGSIRIV